MANERLILAIGQMERALTRIEAAQALTAASAQPDDQGNAALTDLQARHQKLQAAASDALIGIDLILSRQG